MIKLDRLGSAAVKDNKSLLTSLSIRRWTPRNHENALVPLLDKEGLEVVDRRATTPCPLLL